MNDPLSTISTRTTPQTEQADPRQRRNAAGGFAFELDTDARIHRFLTLGTTGGTYYTTEAALTADVAPVVLAVARERGRWLVEQAVAVSTAGRAPRQNPAIFALAAVAGLGDDDARRAALAAIPAVCRTGTTLFTFCRYVEQFRGWGRGLSRGVAAWYLNRPVEDVAYQAVKYRQRDGWTHRDVLRLAHPEPDQGDLSRRTLFDWICRRSVFDSEAWAAGDGLPDVVHGYELAQRATAPQAWVALIERYPMLSWEMLPDAALSEPTVWQALIRVGMPVTALMRQLPRLTRLGVLDDDDALVRVYSDLTDPARLKRGRVHPVSVLVAARTYAAGVSTAGSSMWTPNPRVVDALDAAFYAAYGAVEPAGKRTLVALDVSGSMMAPVSGLPISCREAAAALALVIVSTEPAADVIGFTSGGWGSGTSRAGWGGGVTRLDITPRRRLDDVVSYTSGLSFGGTDCALPMLWAADRGKAYDSFVVITDNETWAGGVHPHQALTQYRDRMVPGARLAVVGMTANDVSIADPADPGQLDVAGFDSAVPNLLGSFFRGDI